MENKEKLKMKKLLLMGLLTFCMTLLIQTPSQATGLFYTNATYPVAITGSKPNDLNALKKGSASTTNVLWIVEVGDAGVDEIAKKAGIKKISYIDVNEKSVFIFWRSLTINVYGE